MQSKFFKFILLFALGINISNAQSTPGKLGVPLYKTEYISLSKIQKYPSLIIKDSDSITIRNNYRLLPENSIGKKNNIVNAFFSQNENDKIKATEEFKSYWKNYSKRWTKDAIQREKPDGVAMRGIWRCIQLYDLVRSFGYLTESDINEFKETLVRTVEYAIGDNPDNLILPGYSLYSWRMSNIWADVALSAGTVAMAFPELPQADKWVNFSVNELIWMLETGVWDGAWHECPRYHLYQMKITANFLVTLYNRTGINLFMHPSVQAMGKWCIDFSTPLDKVAGKEAGYPEGIVLSQGLGDSTWGENMGVLNIFASYIRASNPELSEKLMWLWKRSGYKSSEEPVTDLLINPNLPSRDVFLKSNIALRKGHIAMRSNHNTENEIWLMLKAGNVSLCGHENGDANSFSLIAYGTPMLLDSGSADYNDPRHRRWNKKSISHNVVVFRNNGETYHDKYDDSHWVDAKVTKWETNECYDYSISDASEANNVGLYRRHILFVKPSYFVIWDEIDSDRESSFMLHSPAENILWNKHDFSFITPWNTQLDVHSLLPDRKLEELEYEGRIGAWTDEMPDRTRSWYKFRYQKYIEIKGKPGEDYLTILHPRKSGIKDLKVTFNKKNKTAVITVDGRKDKVTISDGELKLIMNIND